MRILIIGGTGTIGSKLTKRLKEKDKVLTAGHTSGDFQTDITKPDAISKLFKETASIDAVIAATGSAPMKPIDEIVHQDVMEGVKSKMMGQINIALTSLKYLTKGGSVTLTSGILAEDPIPQGSILSTINSAVNGFVVGAYGEFLNKGFRINAVSPALVEDSAEALGDYFPGHSPVKMDDVINAYVKSIKTNITGKIIRAV